MFQVVRPPIIRRAYYCIYSIWYLSHRYCHLPLSWKSLNRFECAVGGVRYILHISRIRVKHKGVSSINLIERTKKCNRVVEYIIPMFLNCSTCFGRHTAHHQELSHRSGRQPKTCVKPEAAIAVFKILMMGGLSPETCWTVKKNNNNNFYYTVVSWSFLWDLYYNAQKSTTTFDGCI
jgi:hypothetical protein